MSSYSKSQQFYHVLPAAASRPVSTALMTGQHARLGPQPAVQISAKAEGACTLKRTYDRHAQAYVVRWGGGMLSIAEGVLNATKTFDQMTSATANKRKRKVQGPHAERLCFASICTIEDAGHPTAA